MLSVQCHAYAPPQHTSPQCRVFSLAIRLLIPFPELTLLATKQILLPGVGRSLSGKSLGEGRLGVVQPDRPDLSSLM